MRRFFITALPVEGAFAEMPAARIPLPLRKHFRASQLRTDTRNFLGRHAAAFQTLPPRLCGGNSLCLTLADVERSFSATNDKSCKTICTVSVPKRSFSRVVSRSGISSTLISTLFLRNRAPLLHHIRKFLPSRSMLFTTSRSPFSDAKASAGMPGVQNPCVRLLIKIHFSAALHTFPARPLTAFILFPLWILPYSHNSAVFYPSYA